MTDVFISYSVKDEDFARFVRAHLLREKLNVFLASISLETGKKWTPQIFESLKEADWVFFLASKSALASHNVQHEIGGAIATGKKLVPIMWDVEPDDLPVWVSQYQGLCLNGQTIESIQSQISELAKKVKADKTKGILVAGGLLAGFLYLISRS